MALKKCLRRVINQLKETIAPGQITDDGELTLAMAHALIDSAHFPREKVAVNYRQWLQSKPFDVGRTTYAALSGAALLDNSVAEAVSHRAAIHNMQSESNGALMRSSALGVWSTRLTREQTVEAAIADTRLTHPNFSCQWVRAVYVVAIRHLLLNSGDAQGAFAQAKEVLACSSEDQSAEVTSWLINAETGNLPSGRSNIGFVRIAFTHAMHHLLCRTPFVDALQQVLSCGGDTDTNACIVGGLVGARVDINGIPSHMTQAVLQCNTGAGRPRPEWLSTRNPMEIACLLVRYASSAQFEEKKTIPTNPHIVRASKEVFSVDRMSGLCTAALKLLSLRVELGRKARLLSTDCQC